MTRERLVAVCGTAWLVIAAILWLPYRTYRGTSPRVPAWSMGIINYKETVGLVPWLLIERGGIGIPPRQPLESQRLLWRGLTVSIALTVVSAAGAYAVHRRIAARLFRYPRCKRCGYNVTALTSSRCPECGGDVPDTGGRSNMQL